MDDLRILSLPVACNYDDDEQNKRGCDDDLTCSSSLLLCRFDSHLSVFCALRSLTILPAGIVVIAGIARLHTVRYDEPVILRHICVERVVIIDYSSCMERR